MSPWKMLWTQKNPDRILYHYSCWNCWTPLYYSSPIFTNPASAASPLILRQLSINSSPPLSIETLPSPQKETPPVPPLLPQTTKTKSVASNTSKSNPNLTHNSVPKPSYASKAKSLSDHSLQRLAPTTSSPNGKPRVVIRMLFLREVLHFTNNM